MQLVQFSSVRMENQTWENCALRFGFRWHWRANEALKWLADLQNCKTFNETFPFRLSVTFYIVSQNVSYLACYDCAIRKRILIFFGRNVTDKAGNQKSLYYATSSNLCFCTTWQKRKHENCIFSQMLQCIARFNQSLLDFFNLFGSRLILTLLYESLNLVINAFSSGLLGAWFRRKEVESAAAVGLRCTMHQCAVFLVSSYAR